VRRPTATVELLGTEPATFSNADGARPKFMSRPMMIDTDPSGFTPTQRRG
jgi:hypothetical protein